MIRLNTFLKIDGVWVLDEWEDCSLSEILFRLVETGFFGQAIVEKVSAGYSAIVSLDGERKYELVRLDRGREFELLLATLYCYFCCRPAAEEGSVLRCNQKAVGSMIEFSPYGLASVAFMHKEEFVKAMEKAPWKVSVWFALLVTPDWEVDDFTRAAELPLEQLVSLLECKSGFWEMSREGALSLLI